MNPHSCKELGTVTNLLASNYTIGNKLYDTINNLKLPVVNFFFRNQVRQSLFSKQLSVPCPAPSVKSLANIFMYTEQKRFSQFKFEFIYFYTESD